MKQGNDALSAAKAPGGQALMREGIRVPDPIILPRPGVVFSRRAVRLAFLAEGHPMADWLRFMAGLARAQQAAVEQLPALAPPSEEHIDRAVAARMPPLSAAGHRPHPAWRHALRLMLEDGDDVALPKASQQVRTSLRGAADEALDALASRCLREGVGADDSGEGFYMTAALQVYFACTAASLDVGRLRLLEQRGLCPVCGSPPACGVVTAAGRAPGARFLHCSLCATAWNHTRAVCTACGSARALVLQEIDGGTGAVKAETCGACNSYIKLLYEGKDPNVDPVADDLASLGLDMLIGDGWSRPPPMGVAGLF
jgi:FdhE protein